MVVPLNDGMEGLDSTLAALMEHRLDRVDFYDDRYPSGTSITDLDGFRSLPTVTKEDFLDAGERASMMFEECLPDASYVVTTSGTSGTATIIPRSTHDEAAEAHKFERMDEYVSPGDRVLIVHNADIERNVVRPALEDRDLFVSYASYTDAHLAAEIVEAVRPDVIWTSPTIALDVADIAAGYGSLHEVDRLVLAGEPLSDHKQERLAERFPAADMYMDYGAQELGRLGYQCAELAGSNTYHVFPETYLYEVLDPGTGEPVADEGELVVTSLVEGSGTPLVRYRTGDRVRVREDACGCDDPAMTVLGRIQFDRLKIAGITVYRENFEEALATVSDLVEQDYQIHLRPTDGDDVSRLEVHLCPRTEADRTDFVRESVEEGIMENFTVTGEDSWADAVEEGWLRPIEVTFVDGISGEAKTKPVVDHRSDD